MSGQDDKVIIGNFKILVIGKSGAGKTSYVNKWLKNRFVENYKATIVSEYSSKVYKYDGKLYKIILWDIAGADHYASVTKTFSKDAQGCITMADAMESISLEETIKWKNALDDSETFVDKGKIPNILIQNKVDLLPQNEIDDMTQLKEFSNKNGFDAYFKTSAKTGYNIKESMDKFIEIIVKRINAMSSKEMSSDRNTIAIDPEKNNEKDKYRNKQTGCC